MNSIRERIRQRRSKRQVRRIKTRNRGRKIEEKVFHIIMFSSTVLIGLCLVLIVGTIFVKGLPALSWEMITQAPSGGFYLGKGGGGILNAILGSLYMGLGAVLLALCLSLPISIYINVYCKKHSRFAQITRLVLDVLWGIPSIVYGAFGFMLMIQFSQKTSLLAGMVILALLIFPVLSRAIDVTFRKVPDELRVISYTVGSTPYEFSIWILLRQSLPGILTAVIIAFGRAIGDAAAVIFTAGYTDRLPQALSQPAATLPLAIFFQLGSPYPSVQNRAYSSALVLTFIILMINFLVRWLNKRFSRNVIK